MRIISDFHDYYDCMMSLDQDRKTLYLRKQEEKEIKGQFCLVGEPAGRIHWSLPTADCWVRGHAIILNKTIYPYLRFKDTYLYSPELAKEYIIPELCHRKRRYKNHSAEHTIDLFFSQQVPQSLSDWIEEYPIIQISDESCYINRKIYSKIVLNPCLKAINFYKKLNMYSVYQEITIFLYNKASPNKPIPVVSDEDMIVAKGFNKFSFRKDKIK